MHFLGIRDLDFCAYAAPRNWHQDLNTGYRLDLVFVSRGHRLCMQSSWLGHQYQTSLLLEGACLTLRYLS